METPTVKTKRGISPIWILPIIALLIGGYLVYRDYQDRGYFINVRIQDAHGLTEGKTQVFFKGLPVGTLRGFSVGPDIQYIDARIEMVKQSKAKLTKDTLFWVVRPVISMNRITGLDTLVKGSYFDIQLGTSKELSDSFTALSAPPPLSALTPGLHLTVTTNETVSLESDSPVYFKKIEVGEIITSHLQPDGSIETKLLIFPEYAEHVSSLSKFYINSGIHLSANLPKISLQIDPLKSVLRGGLSFITPKGGKKITDNKHVFHLYESLLQAKGAGDFMVDLVFSVDHGLETEAEIRFNGIAIGAIANIKLDKDLKTVYAKAHIDKNMKALFTKDAYLWTVNATFSPGGIANLDTLIKGAYINIIPGKEKPSKEFHVHNNRPANIGEKTGLNLVLETDRLGSLGYNKPVYYRQVQVGHTTGYELSPTGQNVLIYANIHPKFVNLIRENTKFWNSTGFRIKGGLMTEMRISTESMAAILAGGISFSTPNKDDMGNRISNGKHFTLYRDPDDQWLTWSPPLVLGAFLEKPASDKKMK